ncbi:unnamed protein product, partial [Symbiodinium microadriaticum]
DSRLCWAACRRSRRSRECFDFACLKTRGELRQPPAHGLGVLWHGARPAPA